MPGIGDLAKVFLLPVKKLEFVYKGLNLIVVRRGSMSESFLTFLAETPGWSPYLGLMLGTLPAFPVVKPSD